VKHRGEIFFAGNRGGSKTIGMTFDVDPEQSASDLAEFADNIAKLVILCSSGNGVRVLHVRSFAVPEVPPSIVDPHLTGG